MDTFRYTATDETFDLLDFHDAVIDSIQVSDHEIVVELEAVNILAGHPLNPYSVAKSTDYCRLIFAHPSLSHATLFQEEKPHRRMECTDLQDMEILQFERREQEECYLYIILGLDSHFCKWVIQAKGFSLHWSEFNGDAWFVD
ncbi:hypothetical protein [Paenibacillus tengchongensis]|uniref:hypothetical protein n=1 Tax=Paenibacillus tengchongensis TaxID=2608684 RepID=UPI00124ED91A|nr:hypothetical protein [Paenibacillus tengchongensis]